MSTLTSDKLALRSLEQLAIFPHKTALMIINKLYDYWLGFTAGWLIMTCRYAVWLNWSIYYTSHERHNVFNRMVTCFDVNKFETRFGQTSLYLKYSPFHLEFLSSS